MKETDPSFPANSPSLSRAADLLYLTIQNRIAQMGDLEVFSCLSVFHKMISTLKNMEEMSLLSFEETKRISEVLVGIEEEMRSLPLDLADQLEMVKETLFNLLSYFQQGNTNAKIIYLISQLPLLFCQHLSEQKAQEVRKALSEKILTLQKLLKKMPPLEQKRLQRKLAIIEETFQKNRSVEELSQKDLDDLFKNLES